MNMQCRKCGEVAYVIVCTVSNLRMGWHLVWGWPLVRFGIHKAPAGYLVRCTRHGCGREWVATEAGLAEPGVTTPERARLQALLGGSVPRETTPGVNGVREPEEPDPSQGLLRGARRKADV